MPRRIDSLKAAVARCVYDLLTEDRDLASRIQYVPGVTSVEVTRTDDLNIQVRVRSNNAPPRYFNIKLSEQH